MFKVEILRLNLKNSSNVQNVFPKIPMYRPKYLRKMHLCSFIRFVREMRSNGRAADSVCHNTGVSSTVFKDERPAGRQNCIPSSTYSKNGMERSMLRIHFHQNIVSILVVEEWLFSVDNEVVGSVVECWYGGESWGIIVCWNRRNKNVTKTYKKTNSKVPDMITLKVKKIAAGKTWNCQPDWCLNIQGLIYSTERSQTRFHS